MAEFCCYSRKRERVLVIRMWQKQGGRVYRVEIHMRWDTCERAGWLPDSPRHPVGTSGLSHLSEVMRNMGFLVLLSSAKERERLEGLGDSWQGLSDLDEASVPTVFYYTALAPNIPWMFTVPSLIKIFSCLCTKWLLAPILLEIPGSSIFLSFYFTLEMQMNKFVLLLRFRCNLASLTQPSITAAVPLSTQDPHQMLPSCWSHMLRFPSH